MSCTLTIDGITVEAETLAAAKRALAKARREAQAAEAEASKDIDAAHERAMAVIGRIACDGFASSMILNGLGSYAPTFAEVVRSDSDMLGSEVGQIRGSDNMTWARFSDRVDTIAIDAGGWTFAARTVEGVWCAIGACNGHTSLAVIPPAVLALNSTFKASGLLETA